MSSTVVETQDLKRELDKAEPATIPDALRKVELGNLLDVKEETLVVNPTGTTLDLTLLPAAVDDRGAALMIQAVEVLSGAAAAGGRLVVPSTDSPSTTQVVLSEDGTQLEFEANVINVRVRWIKGSATALTDKFAPTS